jgi:hypothetical protein
MQTREADIVLVGGLLLELGTWDGNYRRACIYSCETGAYLGRSAAYRPSTDVAVDHIAADAAAGRLWVCACAACRATRATMRKAPKMLARINAAIAAARS